MGMYDTVWFICPRCGECLDIQSKSGRCDLQDYEAYNGVPSYIAVDIEGELIYCPKCHKEYIIKPFKPANDVQMRLEEI